MSNATWPSFLENLETIYLPGFAPAAREAACPLDGVPDDIWLAAKIVFPDPVAWLDNPIPQLSGKSALAACQAGKSDAIREILMNVAGFFLPPPDEVVPWEDWEQGDEVDAGGEGSAG